MGEKPNEINVEETIEEIIVETTTESAETENTETEVVGDEDKRIPYVRFKAKVDEANALRKKLADIETAQADAEREALEEQNEYKTLYKQALTQIEANKADALEAVKTTKLVQAGYSAEQVEVLRNTIDGETDEEIAKSVEDITSVIPPKKDYIHQSPMGGGDGKPKPVGNDGLGKTLYERVMGKK